MSGQKRAAGTSSGPPEKKRRVTVKTAEKWVRENDKEYSTATWLKFDARDRDYVVSLKCSICIRFEEKLHDSRNFNPAFIIGSKNLKASSFKEHAATDMHKRAMLLLRKSQSRSVTDYAPIAKALSTLGSEAEEKLMKKFEIAYLICKEGMAFLKMGPLCQLEEKHGVDLGSGYKNNQACSVFVEYIAQAMKETLVTILDKAKFFSIQGDGSTDSANIEDELFLVLYFDPYATDMRVHVRDKFLTVRRPNRSNAEGLYDNLDLEDWDSLINN